MVETKKDNMGHRPGDTSPSKETTAGPLPMHHLQKLGKGDGISNPNGPGTSGTASGGPKRPNY